MIHVVGTSPEMQFRKTLKPTGPPTGVRFGTTGGQRRSDIGTRR
jgi:hypothetical protein